MPSFNNNNNKQCNLQFFVCTTMKININQTTCSKFPLIYGERNVAMKLLIYRDEGKNKTTYRSDDSNTLVQESHFTHASRKQPSH